MRLQILSDLHLEFADYKLTRTDADVVVLAGDIHQGSQGITWARKQFRNQPVIYVMGNHEFYGHSLQLLLEECRNAAQGSNVHLLENQSVEVSGVTFLGCTLWTDFKLWPKPAEAMEAARDYLTDFKVVRTQNGRLTPRDTVALHQASVAWLKSRLKMNDPARTVVVTHHAPSKKSIQPIFSGEVMNAAFASALDDLVRQSRVPLWIHGHTHHCVDYVIARTRVFSNQKGYSGECNLEFVPDAIIEV
jgi:Icc-related predicted phosphoesterase